MFYPVSSGNADMSHLQTVPSHTQVSMPVLAIATAAEALARSLSSIRDRGPVYFLIYIAQKENAAVVKSGDRGGR
jgi:hypothetical protein